MASQAINQGGHGWNPSGPVAPFSSLRIGPDANGLWTAITCNSRDEQEHLRSLYRQQVGSRHILGTIGDLLVYSEKNAEQKIYIYIYINGVNGAGDVGGGGGIGGTGYRTAAAANQKMQPTKG